ncbi:MAG: precorrin-6y C5,15-methyltransferase (decarboxylating) subunit CbiE [Pseudomonadota bacterium]
MSTASAMHPPTTTAAPWLSVVGLGASGRASLTPAARAVLDSAEVVVGGARHHEIAGSVRPGTERIDWPSPFDALIERLRGSAGRRVVVLATGDPLWFSVGAKLARAFPGETAFFPQVSAFQLAATRLCWSLADADTLSLHGRPAEGIVPFIQPGVRLIALTTGAETPAAVAGLLTKRGYGASRLTVLANMETEAETRHDGIAAQWPHAEVPDFNTLAVECAPDVDAVLAPRVPGLADDLFAGDGTMTKREVRAATLARLMPMPDALLWDVGAGCGSVAIEWMRAARGARAIAIEPRADRRAYAAANATALGTPGLDLREGSAPAALAGLPAPDAVFLGGGLSHGAVAAAWARLKRHGRLVANAVTLESEALLLALHAERGGDLVRLQISRAEPVGGRTGWRAAMAVTQWSAVKR